MRRNRERRTANSDQYSRVWHTIWLCKGGCVAYTLACASVYLLVCTHEVDLFSGLRFDYYPYMHVFRVICQPIIVFCLVAEMQPRNKFVRNRFNQRIGIMLERTVSGFRMGLYDFITCPCEWLTKYCHHCDSENALYSIYCGRWFTERGEISVATPFDVPQSESFSAKTRGKVSWVTVILLYFIRPFIASLCVGLRQTTQWMYAAPLYSRSFFFQLQWA